MALFPYLGAIHKLHFCVFEAYGWPLFCVFEAYGWPPNTEKGPSISYIFTFLKLMDGPFFVFEAYGWPLKNGKRAIHKLHFRVFEAYGWPLFRVFEAYGWPLFVNQRL